MDEDATPEEYVEKVLYTYPSGQILSQIVSHIRVTEGIIDFARSFSSEPIESIACADSEQALVECEREAWFAVSVKPNEKSSWSTNCKLDISALRHALKDIYSYYRLYFPSITEEVLSGENGILSERIKELRKQIRKISILKEQIQEEDPSTWTQQQKDRLDSESQVKNELKEIEAISPVERVRRRITRFLNNEIGALDISTVHCLTEFAGFQFFPVNKPSFLTVQTTLNHIAASLPQIQNMALFFNKHLIWSSFDQEELRLLHKFLVRRLSSQTDFSGFLSEGNMRRKSRPTSSLDSSDSTDTTETDSNTRIRRVSSVSQSRVSAPVVNLSRKQGRLMMYQHKRISFVIFTSMAVDQTESTEIQWRHQTDVEVAEFVGHASPLLEREVDVMMRLIDQTQSTGTLDDSNFRFFYFNQVNLAVKLVGFSSRADGQTKSSDKKQATTSPILERDVVYSLSPTLLHAIDNIHGQLHSSEDVAEVYVQTNEYGWVIGRRAFGRELILLLEDKYTSVMETTEAVQQAHNLLFSQIYSGF